MTSKIRLLDSINNIQAIDNHTHMLIPRTNDISSQISSVVEYLVEKPSDTGVVSRGGIILPMRRSEYREIIVAIKELYGYEQDSITKMNSGKLYSIIMESRKHGVASAYTNALDKANIEIALVNSFDKLTDLDGERFKWVPIVDSFLYPLQEANFRIEPISRFEAHLRSIYKKKGGGPETFEDYLSLIESELKEYKDESAVAVKIWSAFFRSLHFQRINESEAKKIFKAYQTKKKFSTSEYKQLQDFIAYHIFSTCLELDLSVHFHTGFGLANDFIKLSDSSPLNLENLAGDRELEGLKIVLIHGGYPFYKEAGNLARMKEDVYLDFSWLPYLIPPHDLSIILREWLAWKLEDRILFGTDTVDKMWGRKDLVLVHTTKRARKGLALALSGLMHDDILSEEEAKVIARKVMRENALDLYRF